MVRYNPKDNQLFFGWEMGGFKQPNASEIAAVVADIDFAENVDSIDLDPIKPKTDRVQKWFVGNASRVNSFTYDGQYTPGSGSISGELKHGQVIDAVLGIESIAAYGSGRHVIALDGTAVARKTFFAYFNHGDSRAKSINGCSGTSIAISGNENSFITYDLSILSARMFDISSGVPFAPSNLADKEDITRSPFHWKHTAIDFTYDGIGGTSILSLDGQFESFSATITNNIEYKFGAPSSGGQQWSSWFKEMKLDVEISLTFYPSTTDALSIWELAPSENEYANYANLSVNVSNLSVDIMMERDASTDSINLKFEKLVCLTCSERLENIDAGVDPVTMTFGIAEVAPSNNNIEVDILEPINQTSSPYSTLAV